MQTVPHEFQARDLVAGHPALDFANTVTARDTTPCDWLDGYTRLLEWARLAQILDAATAAKLAAAALKAPREASAVLRRARVLREAIHGICVALLEARAAPRAALAELESAWKRTAARARLQASGQQLRLAPDADASGLELPVDLLTFATLTLLTDLDAERTRVCRGHDCGWLFIDTSKGGRRVWCDMATCGNAAKSQRFARGRRAR